MTWGFKLKLIAYIKISCVNRKIIINVDFKFCFQLSLTGGTVYYPLSLDT